MARINPYKSRENFFYLNNNKTIGKVSFSKQALEAERSWLMYLRLCADRTKVKLPLPIAQVVKESGYYCLYLEVIEGYTLEQWINAKGSLSEEIADRVVDDYLALRAVLPTGDDYIVPWGLEWLVVDQVFTADNDAEYVVSKRSQFYAMMDERFRIATGCDAKLPEESSICSRGYVSYKHTSYFISSHSISGF